MLRERYTRRPFSLDRTDGQFIIERLADQVAIGHITYTGLRPRHSASLGMGVVESAWGSGAAREAMRLMVTFLFESMGLRVVGLWTNAENARAIGLAEAVGFTVTVRLRESCYKDGRLCDTLYMDQLRDEYFATSESVDALPTLPVGPGATSPD
jgi:RimJ/RimL family protein N-acetyltransferase